MEGYHDFINGCNYQPLFCNNILSNVLLSLMLGWNNAFLCLDSLCLIERNTYLVILYLTLMRRKHIRNLLLLFVLYKRPFILFFIQKYEKTINVTLFYTKPSIGTKAFNEQLYCKEDIFFKKSMAISPIILIAYKVR